MLIITDEPRKIIDNCIDFDSRRLLGEAIIDAYKWATLLQQNTPQFRNTRGLKRLLPEMKNISIEFFLTKTIDVERLPFRYRYAYNSNKSHPFLEIYNDEIVMHINQVANKSSCARKAFFREKFLKPVRSYMLFEELDEINYDNKHYLQMNHGYQTERPLFITLGLPNQEYKFEGAISILEEYSSIKGKYPTSKIETIEEDFFSQFQQFAEGVEQSEKKIK